MWLWYDSSYDGGLEKARCSLKLQSLLANMTCFLEFAEKARCTMEFLLSPLLKRLVSKITPAQLGLKLDGKTPPFRQSKNSILSTPDEFMSMFDVLQSSKPPCWNINMAVPRPATTELPRLPCVVGRPVKRSMYGCYCPEALV